MSDPNETLAPATHAEILASRIIPGSGLNSASPQDRPRAIILAGQPGAGKGRLNDAAKIELDYDVVPIDPDDLRDAHADIERLRQQHPYTWAGHTHNDASQWGPRSCVQRRLKDAGTSSSTAPSAMVTAPSR